LPGRRSLFGLTAALSVPHLARGQGNLTGWPSDRVTFVTSLPAGSSVDLTTRGFAEKLARMWNRPVVVDNRGGGNGVLACEMVARAKPDGLTLLATSAMTHAANPALYDHLPYDPVRDFAAVTRFGNSPFVLMVNKALGTPTVSALIARLKAEPGRHNFGEGSVPSRVASELLRLLTGIEVTHVGYRGNQAGFPDLLSGRISYMTVDVVGAKPLVDRGDVLALALTDRERHPALSDVPTAAEAGLPDFLFTTWSGVYAPKATSPAVVTKIRDDIVTAYEMPEVRARLEQMGGARGTPTSPEEFQAFTSSEIGAWGRIIRQAGIQLE
jgi:tripartite-type tricarboxylate transporter receptor subunit TctC